MQFFKKNREVLLLKVKIEIVILNYKGHKKSDDLHKQSL